MRVLVIGGYGTFGGRLIDLLLDEPRLTLIVAGRDLSKADSFCRARRGAATLVPARFDRQSGVEEMKRLAPDLVVDAAGPFQLYGDDPYQTVRAALDAGANWIDLADGQQFVAGIADFDQLARDKQRFVLSGASSFPVLCAAVVRRLANGSDVQSITAGIAPSPFARVGFNVVRAIASYAGKPIRVLCGGQWQTLHALISSTTRTISVPGHEPLPATRFALVEVPDLAVLPAEWPSAREVWVGAGPTPAILHRLLWCAAWLVRLRILPSLVPFAALMNWSINTFRWGKHRGGMFVEIVTGGRTRRWHLLAEGDTGPFIPSMAIEAIIRKCLDGSIPVPGARAAHRELELSDYETMFARRGIVAKVLDD